jgi:hypothetical protein
MKTQKEASCRCLLPIAVDFSRLALALKIRLAATYQRLAGSVGMEVDVPNLQRHELAASCLCWL